MLQAIVIGTAVIVCAGVIYSFLVDKDRQREQPHGSSNGSWNAGRWHGEARQRHNRRHLDSEMECVICLEAGPQVKLYPCNHQNLCEPCVNQLISRDKKICPLCRRPIKGYSMVSDS